MERIRNFFRWWFGELRAAFFSEPGPALALVLTEREIALIERGAGADAPLGVAPLDAPDRRERIEALRSIAERRAAGNAEVELRLPRGQVFFGRFPAEEVASEESLLEVTARESGRTGEELAVDRTETRSPAGGRVVEVAAVLRSTLAEALRYARDWGFDPVRVTSVEWPDSFPQGPELFLRRSMQRPPWLRRATIGLAALALLVGAAAGARALGTRAALAEAETARARSLVPAAYQRADILRDLAGFSDAASMAVDSRVDTMQMWYLLSEVTRMLPEDVAIEALRYDDGELRIDGRGYALDMLLERMDRAAVLVGPHLVDTRAQGRASAGFRIEAGTVARGPL